MGDTTKRMLDLLVALQGGDGVSGADLASGLGVSPQTVQRDIERLRSYGYCVESGHGRKARHRLGAGSVIPPLVLDEEAAVAVLSGLALRAAVVDATGADDDGGHADRLMRTLDRLAPQWVRGQATAMTARMLPTVDRAMSRPGMDLVVLLARAIADRELVVVTHTVRARRRARSVVEPYRLIHAGGRWYVLVRHHGEERWVAHRADRLHAVGCTGAHFEPQPLPGDAGDLWLDLLIFYDRARPRTDGAGEIRCEDAR